MSNGNKRAVIDGLFNGTYPTMPTHDKADPFSLDAIEDRKMEVHVTKSHYGDLLIVSADTGRSAMPKLRYNDHSWYSHAFPQCNTAGGWRTRFCDGQHEQGEPNVIVGLFYRAEVDEMCDHGTMQVTDAWALILLRHAGEPTIERFMRAPMPSGSVGILTDDGLEATHHVLVEMAKAGPVGRMSHSLKELQEDEVPKYVVKALRKWTEHVAQSFGQGRF